MKTRRAPKILVGVCLVATILAGNWWFPAFWAELQREVLRHGSRGEISLGALFAVFNVLLLPGGFLTLAAGAFFGVGRGFLVVLAGNTLGAAIAFGLGRLFGQTRARRLLMNSARMAGLESLMKRSGGWQVVALSQLNPLFPTSLLIYLYALTPIPFWKCMGSIALSRIPALLLYVYLGSLGGESLDLLARGGAMPWTLGIGLLLTGALLFVLMRGARHAMSEDLKHSDA